MSVPGRAFFENPDVVHVAKSLLGKHLVSNTGQGLTRGIIVETEAYAGETDRASHAYAGRRTKRTEPMYGSPGTVYVYLCYGIHHLFNVVTNRENVPHAVLIRAIEPVDGIDIMLERRMMEKAAPRMTAGPGCVSRAMGITTDMTGSNVFDGPVRIQDATCVDDSDILASPRVGVAYAGEDASRPWRFRLKGSEWTSPAR